MRIFAYADMESRIKRCMERHPKDENLTEAQMKKRITEIDRNRAKYYAFFSEQKWGARENYDLLVNTSGADIKKTGLCPLRLFGEPCLNKPFALQNSTPGFKQSGVLFCSNRLHSSPASLCFFGYSYILYRLPLNHSPSKWFSGLQKKAVLLKNSRPAFSLDVYAPEIISQTGTGGIRTPRSPSSHRARSGERRC